MAAAMGRITLSHLMDRNLHPFDTLKATGAPDPQGDRAFDDDADCSNRAAERTVQLQRRADATASDPR
jgi:tRNA 2-thiocytidine biosynthesis protein TtcA